MSITDLSTVLSSLQAGNLDQALGESGSALLLAAIRRQAANLRPPLPAGQPGYVLRQLCLQARELGADDLAAELRTRLLGLPEPGLVPEWTTRRISGAVVAEFAVTDSWITALAALPGRRVACADFRGQLRVLDLTAPDADPRPLGDHPGATALAALPGGRVVSKGKGALRIWDPARPGSAVCSFPGSENATSVAALPDGRVVSSAVYALVWDPRMPAGGPVAVADHDGAVMVVAALPDGRVVYAGGGQGRVRVWDPAAGGGHGPVELPGHAGWVKAVAALPDGRVVSVGDDTRVRMWDLATPGYAPVELGTHPSITGLAALPDGRLLSFGGGLLRVWDPVLPGRPVAEIAGSDGADSDVAVLPDSQLATSSGGGRVRVWDLAVLDEAQVTLASLGGHAAGTLAAAMWPDGRVALGGPGERIRILDPAMPFTELIELDGQEPPSPVTGVLAVAALADGRVAAGGSDGRPRVWDPAMPGGDALAFRDDPEPPPSPEPTGEDAFLAGFMRPDRAVRAIAAMPGGRIVTGAMDGRVRMWTLAAPDAGPALVGRHDGPVRAVAVLPGDRVVSAGDDGPVRVWNPVGPFPGPGGPAGPYARAAEFGTPGCAIRQVAVLSDGRVVTGATDGRVQVWDPGTGRVVVELGQHGGYVTAVAALSDGRVISASQGELRLWDVAGAAETARVRCSVEALAVARGPAGNPRGAVANHWLLIAHQIQGVSLWSVPAAG